MIAIIGPTGSGKTETSVKISDYLPISVINADSRQVYKYMNIGTAKPTIDQQNKLDHYVLDKVNPDINYNLNNFIKDSKYAINKIKSQNKTPIIVGGTGLYVWALIDKWALPDVPPDKDFRKNIELEIHTNGFKYVQSLFVKEVGESVSTKFDLNNTRRLIRYLEIIKSIGKEKFLNSSKLKCNNNLIFGLDYSKDDQEEHITNRIEKMIEDGWIAEVEMLIKKGYNLSHHSMSGIGYKEIYLYLRNEIDYNEMKENTLKRTFSLIKKQRTWFKKTDSRIKWLDSDIKSRDINEISKSILQYNKDTTQL